MAHIRIEAIIIIHTEATTIIRTEATEFTVARFEAITIIMAIGYHVKKFAGAS